MSQYVCCTEYVQYLTMMSYLQNLLILGIKTYYTVLCLFDPYHCGHCLVLY